MMDPLLDIHDLRVEYAGRGGRALRAVDGVSLRCARGQCVGLVGESGCGKTTLANAVMGLVEPCAGHIRLQGASVWPVDRGAPRHRPREVQMVFQDPLGALNPRMTLGSALAEVLTVHGLAASSAARDVLVAELMARVGLDAGLAMRFPHELSGGQRQRFCIARALAPQPALLVADEPVSALDVSIQVQILNLLKDLVQGSGLGCLFIAHDLATVRYLCDHVLVMYAGRIVESAPTADLFARPAHAYTATLLAAVPDVEAGLRARQAGGSAA